MADEENVVEEEAEVEAEAPEEPEALEAETAETAEVEAEAELEVTAEDEAPEELIEEDAEPAAEPEGNTRRLNVPANPQIPTDLRAGDSVSVHVLIREGDRERIQEFKGTVIRIRKGGNNASFTVRRIASHGVGVERTFLMRSPLLDKVEIQRRSHVRRARLYYLRDRTGKRARLRERRSG